MSLPVFTGRGVSSVSVGDSDDVRVGGRLDDGAGGPPPGWNTPAQRGWAAIDGDTLTSQDEHGHTGVSQRAASEEVPPSCG